MPPLQYHPGQIAVQEEANTRALADQLSHWVGPVGQIAVEADLLVLAVRGEDGAIEVRLLSGPAPLVEVRGPGRLALLLPPGATLPAGPAGGLAMSSSVLRRARINGTVFTEDGTVFLDASETFTLCRKYISPSLPTDTALRFGPETRRPLSLEDDAIAMALARAETAFLLSEAPDGAPDVAHRGGPPGFISYDGVSRRLRWPEFLGDGVFKSAGNVRASSRLTLFVPDFEDGGGVELSCTGATYENRLTSRKRRLDPLVEHRDPFPTQGVIEARVERAVRTDGATGARRRIERALRVNSCSTVDIQAPQ